jgi:hypothetical protein
MLGQLTLENEQAIVTDTKQWVTERVGQFEVYQTYLDHWGNWTNPWPEKT